MRRAGMLPEGSETEVSPLSRDGSVFLQRRFVEAVLLPGPQNVTLFGSRVTADIISSDEVTEQ